MRDSTLKRYAAEAVAVPAPCEPGELLHRPIYRLLKDGRKRCYCLYCCKTRAKDARDKYYTPEVAAKRREAAKAKAQSEGRPYITRAGKKVGK